MRNGNLLIYFGEISFTKNILHHYILDILKRIWRRCELTPGEYDSQFYLDFYSACLYGRNVMTVWLGSWRSICPCLSEAYYCLSHIINRSRIEECDGKRWKNMPKRKKLVCVNRKKRKEKIRWKENKYSDWRGKVLKRKKDAFSSSLPGD